MSFLKLLIPQKLINIFYHFSKAVLANIIYGFPTRKLKVIGITGTDGKTTTTNMVYWILKNSGKKVSMVSTINATIAGKVFDTGFHVTSPDSFAIQKLARQAVDNGDEYLVLEVTSHALDQYRVWGIEFEVGAITNITRDHLDYHKNLTNYTQAKLKLLDNSKHVVVNIGLKNISKRPLQKTFGLRDGDFSQKRLNLKLQIPGDYNIENGLAAIAITGFMGIAENEAVKALGSFNNLSGRMEEVSNNLGIKIIVDFAHTPNGLTQALKTLKRDDSRLIAVFGSASKRDTSKRPLMGEVAGENADLIILTSEDPRGESVENICKQIAKGLEKSGKTLNKNYWIITDRKDAIKFGLSLAKKGDIVGIFGKGHERSMNLDGKKEIPWSDVEVVKDVLGSQGKINSPTRLPN